ncbi:hypothetical protein LCM08_00115 [Salipiger pacificus]|nr:hypothetical protein [Alloyangia pacifica]MCA0943309.1 hypothetical protein [Alloyangia pacifica]
MKKFHFTLALLAFSQTFAALPGQAQSPTDSDLQALRFYMNEANDQAVRSEVRRLQLRYPDWVVPEDLGALQQGSPDAAVAAIYREIRSGNFTRARAIIEETGRATPSWAPSPELLAALSIAESQSNFDQAVSRGEPGAAIKIARANPDLLRCERVNNAWLLAEQYQAAREPALALTTLSAIVRSCADPNILVATLEKSVAVANLEQLATMADAARALAPGAAERLTSVETRLRAGLQAQPRQLASATPSGTPAPFEAPDSGGALTSTKSQQPAQRPVAPAPNRKPSGGDTAALTQARAAAQRADWSTCLAASVKGTGPEIVSQRAWCALNAKRPMQALNDFKYAASQSPTAEGRRDARYGLALVMLQLNMVDQAATVAATTHFSDQQRLEVETQILDKRGISAYQRHDYRRAIAYFDELERLSGVVRRDIALLRGYAYLNSGQRARARAEFQAIHDKLATPDSRRALSRALH